MKTEVTSNKPKVELIEEKSVMIDTLDKYFPEADGWMWNYCTFLGKYIDPDGKKWDLGILLKGDDENWFDDRGNWCAACVYGNEQSDYVSGSEKDYEHRTIGNRPFLEEMIRRAKVLNLINKKTK